MVIPCAQLTCWGIQSTAHYTLTSIHCIKHACACKLTQRGPGVVQTVKFARVVVCAAIGYIVSTIWSPYHKLVVSVE